MKITDTCVAQFERLAIDEFGGDCKVRIYKADNGFVPCFYNSEGYQFAGNASETFGGAVQDAMSWLDNSHFHL